MSTPIPRNAAPFTLAEVLAATGGRVAVGAGDASARGVMTDSRGDVSGALFIALKGERFDAHHFLEQVARGGAAMALVEDPHPEIQGLLQIQVACTLTALGDLALAHRRRWDGLVVAVGGSAGKTTTKACVSRVLSELIPGGIHAQRGNLNNRIGAPMVLLGCDARHRVAVVELGTNLRGEVAELARISEPDIGVVTLIDFEHTEGIGDLDAIEAEEGDLFRGLKSDGVAVGNVDDTRVARQLEQAASTGRAVESYGKAPTARYRLLRREPVGVSGARLTASRAGFGGEIELRSSLLGYPGALASVCAALVADAVSARLGLPMPDPELFSRALESSEVAENGRLCARAMLDGALVLDDSYNSNPGSVLSSVAVARELAAERGGRVFAVLGEMLELGPLSEREHRRIGAELAQFGLASLIAVQGDAQFLAEEAAARGVSSVFVADAGQAVQALQGKPTPEDVILVKGSRGVKLERVVAALLAGTSSEPLGVHAPGPANEGPSAP